MAVGRASRLSEAEQFDQFLQIELHRTSRIIIAMSARRRRLPVEILRRFIIDMYLARLRALALTG
jgi:hypothetical protein